MEWLDPPLGLARQQNLLSPTFCSTSLLPHHTHYMLSLWHNGSLVCCTHREHAPRMSGIKLNSLKRSRSRHKDKSFIFILWEKKRCLFSSIPYSLHMWALFLLFTNCLPSSDDTRFVTTMSRPVFKILSTHFGNPGPPKGNDDTLPCKLQAKAWEIWHMARIQSFHGMSH